MIIMSLSDNKQITHQYVAWIVRYTSIQNATENKAVIIEVCISSISSQHLSVRLCGGGRCWRHSATVQMLRVLIIYVLPINTLTWRVNLLPCCHFFLPIAGPHFLFCPEEGWSVLPLSELSSIVHEIIWCHPGDICVELNPITPSHDASKWPISPDVGWLLVSVNEKQLRCHIWLSLYDYVFTCCSFNV